jgi:hypothetical protein
MLIDRNSRVPSSEGSMTAHEPGIYEAVLQRVCHQQTDNGDEVLKCGTAEELAEVNRRHAERTAALVRERYGQPVTCQSYQLPRGLHAPFNRWPGGNRRMFVVMPDDTITLKMTEARP